METAKKIRVSMLQMSSIVGDIGANCKKIENSLNSEKENFTDVLVLPEVWSVGWACDKFIDSAENLSDSSIIKFLSKVAKKYNINIIGGSIITKSSDKFYNTCPVISRSGELIDTYSKMHLYSYYGCNEGNYISSGNSPVMVEIDGVNFGLSICYDIRFPEIYRAYRKSNADILVNCAAWGASKSIPWEMMTKSRAIENQCYMIALTQCGHIVNQEYNLGESRIIDYKGDEISSIMHDEGIVTAMLDIDSMYDFRNKCTILNDIKENYEVKCYAKAY